MRQQLCEWQPCLLQIKGRACSTPPPPPAGDLIRQASSATRCETYSPANLQTDLYAYPRLDSTTTPNLASTASAYLPNLPRTCAPGPSSLRTTKTACHSQVEWQPLLCFALLGAWGEGRPPTPRAVRCPIHSIE